MVGYASGQDPLCYPGTSVLINKAGLRDQDALDEFEAGMFTTRAEEAWPSGNLNVAYYRRLHHHLFQDVYDWAGRFRTIRIAKGGNWFCYPEYIDAEMDRLFLSAGEEDWFTGLPKAAFVVRIADFLAELNAIHPFREGNGRTQLALLSILIDLAGYGFDDEALEPGRVLNAMIESFAGDTSALETLVADIIAA